MPHSRDADNSQVADKITRLVCTANASKLTEKYFFDLRNLFSDQGNFRVFFSKQEKLTEKTFLVYSARNLP